MIWCYNPPGKFSRIYLWIPEDQTRESISQDKVWELIKLTYYHMEEDDERLFWDTIAEQNSERDLWFLGWKNPSFWKPHGLMVMDNHY